MQSSVDQCMASDNLRPGIDVHQATSTRQLANRVKLNRESDSRRARVGWYWRRAGEADTESWRGCSTACLIFSLYMRFQTAIGKPPRPALLEQLICPNGAAWVAERDREVVGHAMWARVNGATVPTAELALIVAVPEQRRGLGVRMITEAAHDALASGAAQLVVMVSAMNDRVLRMIRHRWPTATTERDGAPPQLHHPSRRLLRQRQLVLQEKWVLYVVGLRGDQQPPAQVLSLTCGRGRRST